MTMHILYYALKTDDGQQGSAVAIYAPIWDTSSAMNIYAGMASSEIFYLTKGWHTVYLHGQSNFYGNSGKYTISGSMSIMAFPEYTVITVTSPNGGESWLHGTSKTITWKSDGNPGANVIIELYKAGVKNAVISSKTPNDGSYGWYIPSYQPLGPDYKIKITSYDDSKYYDWSNNNFKIY